MSSIAVVLSSSKYAIVAPGQGVNELDEMRKLDFPICVATMALGLFNYGKELEVEELHHAQMMMAMAKAVFVDSSRRYVFIGEDPADEDTGLVVYTQDSSTECTNAFFRRWDAIHVLSFEFQVVNPMQKRELFGGRFCIRGVWINNHWLSLDILPTCRTETVIP